MAPVVQLNLLRAAVFAAALLTTAFAQSADLAGLQNDFSKSPVFKDAQNSVYAKYINGPVIAEVNPDARLSPASILKLFTTAAALDILGANHHFITEVYHSGQLKGSTVSGDVYIRGGGDPALGSTRMPGTPRLEALVDGWVAQFKALGIKKIDGNIYGDNSIYGGIKLPWRTTYQNIGNYFAAPVDGLSARDNSFDIYFEPSVTDGATAQIARVEPKIKDLEIISSVKISAATTGDNSFVTFVPGSSRAEIFGTIPPSREGFRVSAAMPSPALFLADYFKDKLEAAGIKVKGKAALQKPLTYKDKTLVLIHGSPPVGDIIKFVNKRSFNLSAATLLNAMSAYGGGPGSVEDGILRVKDFLARHNIDTNNFDIFDGSGLARDNIISCRIVVDMLEAALNQPYKDVFLDSLPVAGDPEDTGNMSRHLRGSSAAYKARVKTGMLERVRSYAGYTKDSNGRDIAFCIITNNLKGAAKEADPMHHAIITALSDIGLNKKPAKKGTATRP